MHNFVFFKSPKNIQKLLIKFKSIDSKILDDQGLSKAVKLANFTLKKTPGYKKYLKENKFKHQKITKSNFKKLPLVSKNEYLKKTEYKQLFPIGGLEKVTTISSTSGSTGEPFYFPRGEEQDQQYQFVAEMFLKNQFEIDKYSSLAINGFGLGIWIGGIYTYKNFNVLAQKGYKIAMAPAGTNKEIFLKTIKKQAYLFDQVILMGYPPFIKDVIDEAPDYGIDFKKYKIKIMTATESFTENFRDYLCSKTGIDPLTDIINIYGSVEFGTMSHETSLTNLIRRRLLKNKKAYKAIFGETNLLPTLVQYYPHIVYFEQFEDEVLATGYGSSFPLIRYKFHDRGGVISFNEMIKKLKENNIDIYKEAKKVKIDKQILKLPFVFVHERSDFVVVVRGANIYPQNIKNALTKKSLIDKVTGRFVMQKLEDKKLNERLCVHVELQRDISISKKLENSIVEAIIESLIKDNSEYNYLYNLEGAKKLRPIVDLHKFEDPKYFKRDVIKQKWVKN